MRKAGESFFLMLILLTGLAGLAYAAEVVPNEIKQPGSQPEDGINLESPDKCDNCHGGYDEARVYSNEPAFGWRGSAMGNAGRDPIFWATLAIAEQDFDGSGDLCIRCHSSGGWFAGRSTPTDGSGLQASDDNGIDCDTCHKATNPDNSEHLGVMSPPFVANDPTTGEGYYGSGILSMWSGSDKLGPYSDAEARHQFMQSEFHRGDICGSCHDVSNPAVGDLAPNNGIQPWADPVISSGGDLGGPIEAKAAFNNPPYKYGIVERTFSEWKSGGLDDMPVTNFPNLPSDLQVGHGALRMAYDSANLAGGTYEDGTVRNFSCQSCHMRPDVGEGCNKNPPTRSDLPKHDMTGGNYWMWPLIKYQDQQGTLRLGGGLTQTQIEAMDAGQRRGEDQLGMAADLTVNGNVAKITNLTGHKLITGYPEGRRMWLNIKWYDAAGALLREDGAYGPLGVTFTNPVDGSSFEPWSILDLHDPNTKIYEVHPAITKEWASTLVAVNASIYDPLVLGYDRLTGAPVGTIGDLATGPDAYAETFHFVLNNHISKDNRIPPYGMVCDDARVRNALPVPPDQYGGPATPTPGCSDVYDYWDEIQLNPPAGATGADLSLLYQGTSWEYVQFLWLANNEQNAFLGQEGVNFLDAWLYADPANPMVPPFVMATTTWGSGGCTPTEDPEVTCDDGIDNDCDGLTDGADPDCTVCTPTEDPEVTCDDGIDNDCDGLTDGADPDCQTTMECILYTSKGPCNDDPACEWVGSPKNGSCQDAVVCSPTGPEAGNCSDGIDNDCDGLIDCADTADCGADPICQVSCSDYTTRTLCNAQATCRWDNKAKVCIPN